MSEAHHLMQEQREWTSGLSRSLIDEVSTATTEIREFTRRTAENVYEVGERLLRVKKVLRNHAERFDLWLKEEFDWSGRTARRLMEVALKLRRPSQNGQIGQYAPSALYLLASDSTPEEARQEAEGQSKVGKRITYKAAQEIVEQHKAAQESFDSLAPEHQQEIAQKLKDREEEDDWPERMETAIEMVEQLFGERELRKQDRKKVASALGLLSKLARKYEG